MDQLRKMEILKRAENEDVTVLFLTFTEFVDDILDANLNNIFHILAKHGRPEILAHPDYHRFSVFNKDGDKPEHILAKTPAAVSLLKYDTILASIDERGDSCIEIIASMGRVKELLNHHLADCMFNKGKTPRQIYKESINLHNGLINDFNSFMNNKTDSLIKLIDNAHEDTKNSKLVFKSIGGVPTISEAMQEFAAELMEVDDVYVDFSKLRPGGDPVALIPSSAITENKYAICSLTDINKSFSGKPGFKVEIDNIPLKECTFDDISFTTISHALHLAKANGFHGIIFQASPDHLECKLSIDDENETITLHSLEDFKDGDENV
jgi:hypothetical protein